MNEQLLQTKFHIPPLRPNFVSRPLLIEMLNRGLDRKVTLVSAPAGFGKTTLVAGWLAGSKNQARPLATWLSLEKDDNDLARFLTYLVAALQQVDVSIGRKLFDLAQSPPLPATETMITALVNDLAAAPSLILILDDYHFLNNPGIHDFLTRLVHYQPASFHLVLVGRGEPTWLPLAQLRASGLITEIRPQALRFTTAEAAAFLADRELSEAEVATLESKTEGWIAGLQMAALALPGRDERKQFIQAFSGSDRYLGDYLVDEVLGHLAPETRQFLEQTAFLDQLCGPLCKAVTGRKDSHVMLERLERDGLFVTPLDNRQYWYRYHQLFAQFLRDRMQRVQPDLMPTLHQRASRWYTEQDMPHAAVRHALAMNAPEEALTLIARYDKWLFQRGRIATLIDWLRPFPEEMLYSQPRLSLYLCWALLIQGETDWALDLTNRLEPHIAEEHLGELLTIRAGLARQRGDFQATHTLSEQAMEALDETNALRGTVTLYQSDLMIGEGQTSKAKTRLINTLRQFRSQKRYYLETQALHRLITVHTILGELHQAAALCGEAFATMERHQLPFVVGGFHNAMAKIQWEWNELDAAGEYLEEGIRVGKNGGHTPMLAANTLLLAQIRQAQGQKGAAQVLIADAGSLVTDFPRVETKIAAWQAWIALKQGQTEPARRWITERGLSSGDTLDYYNLIDYLLLLRLLMVRSEWRKARRLLERMLQSAKQVGACGIHIQLLLYLAELHTAQGRMAMATKSVERALALGEPGGYIRRFVEDGRPLLSILVQLQDRYLTEAAPYSRAYLERVLAGFDETAVAEALHPVALAENFRLSETISRRELEILQLMGRGLSNPQIAKRLHISVDTVRWHVKNIYNKLEVNNRVQATVRAQSIGLLH